MSVILASSSPISAIRRSYSFRSADLPEPEDPPTLQRPLEGTVVAALLWSSDLESSLGAESRLDFFGTGSVTSGWWLSDPSSSFSNSLSVGEPSDSSSSPISSSESLETWSELLGAYGCNLFPLRTAAMSWNNFLTSASLDVGYRISTWNRYEIN